MSDTSKQLNLNGDDSFEFVLTQRLLKRATEPLGVIDVRYAEEKYLRIVRWLARCTALRDHLSRRYGIEEANAYGERPFAGHRRGGQVIVSNTIQTFLSAGLPSGSLPGTESRTNASQSTQSETQQETWRDRHPSGLADILAERSANPAVEPSSPEGTFRISRRPPPWLLESDAPQISGRVATPTKDAKQDLVSPRSAPITQQMPFSNTVNEGEAANVARTTRGREPDGPQVLPATGNERAGATSSDATSSIVHLEPAGGSRAQERPAGDAANNRREDASESSRLHSLPLVTPTIVPPRTERVPSPEPGANPRMRPHDAIARDRSRSLASSVPRVTDGFESRDESSKTEKPELVLRRGARETGDASPALPGSASRLRGVSSAAVASEIPGESVNTERPDLVLREQVASRADGSRTRETQSVEPVELAPFTKRHAQNVSPPNYQAQSRELLVEDISPRVIRSISERVMRALTLDLKLERERRGVTKWR